MGTPPEDPNREASTWKLESLVESGGTGDDEFLGRVRSDEMAAEPSANPGLLGDAGDMVNSSGGLADCSAPDCAPVKGSETCRLFPSLGSAPRLGRRILPEVLDTQLPADAKGIETDFRGTFDGVTSGDGEYSSTGWVGGRGVSYMSAAGSSFGGAEALDTILGLTRWTRCAG